MVTERTKKKLLDLYASIREGDLSSGGEVSQQMFLSRAGVIISEEIAETRPKAVVGKPEEQ